MFLNTKSAAEDDWEGEVVVSQLPALRFASDIIMAYWLRGHPNPGNLKYYFVNHVVNTETLPLIASIIKSNGLTTVPYWPGITYSMATPECAALLGECIKYTLNSFCNATNPSNPSLHRLARRCHARFSPLAAQSRAWYQACY